MASIFRYRRKVFIASFDAEQTIVSFGADVSDCFVIGVWKCFKASRFFNQKKNFFRFLMLFNNSFSRLGVGLGRKDVFSSAHNQNIHGTAK